MTRLAQEKGERGQMLMNGQQRREQLLQILAGSKRPISGADLAGRLKVSRQVIVQDIALLRANGAEIFSASRGYMMLGISRKASRILKVRHSDEDTEEEMTSIIDMGGRIQDVFIYHKVYGVVRAKMDIRSRKDIYGFLQDILAGKSSLLKNVTAGYHYHTILADDEKTLDEIQEKLGEKGMLARLQDYEPVDFWGSMDGGNE